MQPRIARLTVVTSSVALCLALLTAPVAGAPEGSDAAATTTAKAQHGKWKKFCHGHRATIVGNKKANRLLGTDGRDVIWAGRGADTIAALDGRDLVCGGPGADVIEGSGDKDRLYGDKGRDFCTGESGEHRHHYSCETHLNVFGYEVDPPNAPDDADRNAARAEKVPAAEVPASAMRGNTYFTSDSPVCAPDGIALTTVRLGNVYFKTYHTNPGYIAIRPAYFRVGDSGFMQGPFYNGTDWTQLYAPADNTVYSYDMYGRTVPRNDRVFWIYEVYWWDGFNWTNFDKVAVPGHYLQTTTGLLYTGTCWV